MRHPETATDLSVKNYGDKNESAKLLPATVKCFKCSLGEWVFVMLSLVREPIFSNWASKLPKRPTPTEKGAPKGAPKGAHSEFGREPKGSEPPSHRRARTCVLLCHRRGRPPLQRCVCRWRVARTLDFRRR